MSLVLPVSPVVFVKKQEPSVCFCSQLHISRYVHPSLHVSPPLLPRNQPGRSWERGVGVGWRQEKKGPGQ